MDEASATPENMIAPIKHKVKILATFFMTILLFREVILSLLVCCALINAPANSITLDNVLLTKTKDTRSCDRVSFDKT